MIIFASVRTNKDTKTLWHWHLSKLSTSFLRLLEWRYYNLDATGKLDAGSPVIIQDPLAEILHMFLLTLHFSNPCICWSIVCLLLLLALCFVCVSLCICCVSFCFVALFVYPGLKLTFDELYSFLGQSPSMSWQWPSESLHLFGLGFLICYWWWMHCFIDLDFPLLH